LDVEKMRFRLICIAPLCPYLLPEEIVLFQPFFASSLGLEPHSQNFFFFVNTNGLNKLECLFGKAS
jgi:hypothetical protein